MIIGTLNIRGGGSLIKRKRVNNIICKGRADFFMIQETKLEDISETLAESFWSGDDIGYSFLASEGRSGGIVSLWRNNTVTVIAGFRGKGFLGTKVSWKNAVYYIVNIYSPCSIHLKRDLWKNLLELKQRFSDGDWIIGGDFNAVKKRRERYGRSSDSNSVERREFSDFIDGCGLVDVPCKGKKFSWYSGDGRSKSRIDRILVSDAIVSSWGVVGQFIGNRDISDHCPVWLEVDKEDWGPKPFKFNNEWFSNKDFLPFVEREWMKLDVSGRGDFVLKEKFRLIKDKLNWWNREVFGKFNLEMEEGVRDLNNLDDMEATDEESLGLKREANNRFWLNLKIKENMLIQKYRLKWLNDGDSNSKFFHKVMMRGGEGTILAL
ncbi:uncharacterized protein LOC131614210 [Vicia villosa]|uniref:uncharacterized protein LOC131614210 n=1 Tax=Vicia villosa TaxID=3911 RepID=UPI00273BE3F8|nr:uncharacterized protein LOC131614210 [Vicia villosa]